MMSRLVGPNIVDDSGETHDVVRRSALRSDDRMADPVFAEIVANAEAAAEAFGRPNAELLLGFAAVIGANVTHFVLLAAMGTRTPSALVFVVWVVATLVLVLVGAEAAAAAGGAGGRGYPAAQRAVRGVCLQPARALRRGRGRGVPGVRCGMAGGAGGEAAHVWSDRTGERGVARVRHSGPGAVGPGGARACARGSSIAREPSRDRPAGGRPKIATEGAPGAAQTDGAGGGFTHES
ncbi:MAG: hypothetical protein HND58_15720 [Planctomycetota bacterium]|nr:MAG: hypothetical protein HND58_15720 [Planctomycetota bacterium]